LSVGLKLSVFESSACHDTTRKAGMRMAMMMKGTAGRNPPDVRHFNEGVPIRHRGGFSRQFFRRSSLFGIP